MKRLFSLILAISLTTPLFAQDDNAQAKALIRDGRCADAIAPLQKVSKAKFKTHAGAQASVMLTECYLREHKREEAMQLASRFLEYHVGSEYRERMELAHAFWPIPRTLPRRAVPRKSPSRRSRQAS